MSDPVARLRMFAGPNGSGKTTVKTALGKPPAWFGLYINPDDLERTIRDLGHLPLSSLDLDATTAEVREHFRGSAFLKSRGLMGPIDAIACRDHAIDFQGLSFTSYHASVLSDFLLQKALRDRRSFTFETVMSAPDEIEVLKKARRCGFRTYLYFFATEDPAINIRRVQNRVAGGGHDVPAEKIVARYHRCLKLLPEAVRHTSRAYFFDTSAEQAWYFAEATDGRSLELKSDRIPRWFEPVWDRLGTCGR